MDEIEKAKAAAIHNASKVVAGYLTRPDQLDKVEQIRRRVLRNKASVDSRLKTAVQSQVDGIRGGLQELKSAQKCITEIKAVISEVNSIFVECKPLNAKLDQVLIAHNKHERLAKTNEHLKQIFNVPETIAKTKDFIAESKFLQAHKNIMELEATRDDLLFELYKIHQLDLYSDPIEESPIFTYFAEVQELSNKLWKQLSTVIDRTLSASRSNPTQIVTALRIVEREERSDNRCTEQHKKNGFMPPGRPKNFKQESMKTLKRSVENRFMSNQMELLDKTQKMWMVKHLERMRQLIKEDLQIIKYLVSPCFPGYYNIFHEYVLLYHEQTSKTLEDFALNQTNPDECVMLLAWQNEYYGVELLSSPELKDSIEKFRTELKPLLSKNVLDSLMEIYVSTTEKNLETWLAKMGESESQDWLTEKPPETDSDGGYQTSLPIILFQMLDQNVQVGAHIEQKVKLDVIDVCIKCLQKFTGLFSDLIRQFKSRYFENRASVQYFEAYMVAITNNCLSIAEYTEQMKGQLKHEFGEDTFGIQRAAEFTGTVKGYESLSMDVLGYLLDGAFLDLEVFFQDLMTRKWLASSVIVDTIIVTIEDYVNDYTFLKESAFTLIMQKARERIVIEYVKACMQRRITFRSFEERKEGATQLIDETKKIAGTFAKLAKFPEEIEDTPCYSLLKIAEVLKVKEAKDPVVITLELSGLASDNIDFQMDHALALLALRGDMGRTECRQTASQITFQEFDPSNKKLDGLVFSQVAVASSVLDKLEAKLATQN